MPDHVTKIVDMASDEIDSFLANVEQSLGDVEGMVEPNPEELAAFFFKQSGLYPPVAFRYPDSKVVFASPWILALGECDNGDEWLRKFDRFVQRNEVI